MDVLASSTGFVLGVPSQLRQSALPVWLRRSSHAEGALLNCNFWQRRHVCGRKSRSTRDGRCRRINRIMVQSNVNDEENDKSSGTEQQLDIQAEASPAAEKQQEASPREKPTNGASPGLLQHWNTRSWSPEDTVIPQDSYNGWALPVELDKVKTDIAFVAGLPEITAGLALALGLAVFGLTAMHKKDMNLVRLQPIGGPVASRTVEMQSREEVADKVQGNGASSAAQIEKPEPSEQAPSEAKSNGAGSAEEENEGGVGASDGIAAVQGESTSADVFLQDTQAGQFDEAAEAGKDKQSPVANQNANEGDEESQIVSSEHTSDGQDEGLRKTEKKAKDGASQEDAKRQSLEAEIEPEGEDLDFSKLVPWAQAMEAEEDQVEGHFVAEEPQAEAMAPSVAIQQQADVSPTADAPATPFPVPLSSRSGPTPPAPVSPPKKSGKAGRVVVPAVVDPAQAQALEALQALKVIDDGVDPAGICTRREYARWVLSASNVLSRNPGDRVYPSMYVEDLTELAFEDVQPDDSDFAAIQGLAEAGLISSKLSRSDLGCQRGIVKPGCSGGSGTQFRPDSPLTRQDMISWKVALEHRNLPMPSKNEVKKSSGYLDVDRIDPDALPAIAYDLSTADRSIITAAFGYTRRFEPNKPVTRAQAACTLALGESAELVGEELSRIEAENMARDAVAAAVEAEAAEARAERAAVDAANQELDVEREKRTEAERGAQAARQELKEAWQARKQDLESIEKTKAATETERQVLERFRKEAEEQIASLASNREKLEAEKRRLESLRSQAEAERDATSQVKSELDAERRALGMARLWAEEQANAARDEARRLKATRRSLEQEKTAAASILEKLPVEEILPLPKWPEAPLEEGRAGVLESSQTNGTVADWTEQLKPGEVMAKGEEWKKGTEAAFKRTVEKLDKDTKEAVKGFEEKRQEAVKGFEGKRQTAWEDVVKATGGMREGAAYKFGKLSAGAKGKSEEVAAFVSENTKKLADNLKESADKLRQKLKPT